MEYIAVGQIHYPKNMADEFAVMAIRYASLVYYPSGQVNVARDYSLAEAFLSGKFVLTGDQELALHYALTHPLFCWYRGALAKGPGSGYMRAEPRAPKEYGYSLVKPVGKIHDDGIWRAEPGQEMFTSAVPSHYYNDPGDFHLFRPAPYSPITVIHDIPAVEAATVPLEVLAADSVPLEAPAADSGEYMATPFGPVKK